MANDDSGISESDNCTYNTLNGFSTLLKSASLVVTPSSYKEGKLYSVIPSDGSGDMSVVRATTATRVNSAGLVELVPYNLCDYSEDQTQWTSQDETTVTANSTTAPNGTLTADTVTPTAVNTDHYRGIVLSSQVGELTAFIYVKPNGYNFFDWGIWNGSQYLVRATFDLVNLTYTFTNAGTATIESVGNGWLKCGISGSNASLSTIALYYRVRPTGGAGGFTGNGTSGAFIWGAQLVEGSTAKDYQKTETRLNIPRLDYSNGTCPSLLVEPQRTNLFFPSQKISGYIVGGMTNTDNQTISPDGIQNAGKSTIGNTFRFYDVITDLLSVLSGTTYTTSFYAKKGVGIEAIYFYQSDGNRIAKFNLNNGSYIGNAAGNGYGSFTSYSSKSVGNGWYRFTATYSSTTTSTQFVIGVSSNTNDVVTQIQGNGTDYVYVWGLQYEAGNYSTSYIPTTSASVTRNADLISKTGISSLIGQTEGTMFFDIVFPQNTTPSYIGISDGATSNRLILGCEFGTFFTFGYGYSTLPLSINTPYKIALAYNSTNMKIYANGSLIATVLGSVPSGMNRFAFDSGGNTQHLIASVKSAALWKTKLSDTQLAQLTTL
jgi:hypothetical protein